MLYCYFFNRGARASNNQPLHTNSFSGSVKKPDVHDAGKKLAPNEESTVSQNESNAEESVGKESNADGRISIYSSSFASIQPANLPLNGKPHGPPTTKQPPNNTNIVDSSLFSSRLSSDRDSAMNGSMENICTDISSMGIRDNQILENGYGEHFRETETSQASGTTANTSEDRLGIPSQVIKSDVDDIEDDLLSFNNQRLKDPEVATNRTLDYSHHIGHLNISSPDFNKADTLIRSHKH